MFKTPSKAIEDLSVEDERLVKLPDGRDLEISILTYPIPVNDQLTLIDLWWTEWTKADYDWLRSMRGAYSSTLRIRSAVARIEGRAVATASVCYACDSPEVSTVGSVLTHPNYRGLGMAAQLTETVAQLSFADGCKVSYLGATRSPRCVYLRCGFEWWNGGVMRRPAPGAGDCEQGMFAAGQKTRLREACWGDLPGMACLVVQPLESLVLDYPRALLSGKYVTLQRCVSNFPVVHDQVTERDGAMCVVAGEAPHRILGFGTLTPDPGVARRHKAVIDVAAHDAYDSELDVMVCHLLERAKERQIESVQAYVAVWDRRKADRFKRFGFRPIATLPGQLRVAEQNVDVEVLESEVR
ncbi:MAG: GNAT family N-acetyltransferase [Acidimicrobiia bacterium]|nr:GNAT family N-acetyltransferase [Acidimicrobiia bacterium]